MSQKFKYKSYDEFFQSFLSPSPVLGRGARGEGLGHSDAVVLNITGTNVTFAIHTGSLPA